jgi:hypothetical protein
MEGGEDPTLDKQYSQVDVFVRRSAVCQTGRELRSAPHCEVILSVNLDPAGFRRRGDEFCGVKTIRFKVGMDLVTLFPEHKQTIKRNVVRWASRFLRTQPVCKLLGRPSCVDPWMGLRFSSNVAQRTLQGRSDPSNQIIGHWFLYLTLPMETSRSTICHLAVNIMTVCGAK